MKSQKAQLKIQEMSFMLVALVIFFVLVGLFALSIIYSNLKSEATEIAESKTLSSITNLADSPEFSCGEPNCVDADKLIVLLDKENYEKNFWPFSSLKIIRLQAFDKPEIEMKKCTVQNYPYCDVFEVYDKQVANERAVSSYVALCRVELENNINYQKCEIAKFVAGTELK